MRSHPFSHLVEKGQKAAFDGPEAGPEEDGAGELQFEIGACADHEGGCGRRATDGDEDEFVPQGNSWSVGENHGIASGDDLHRRRHDSGDDGVGDENRQCQQGETIVNEDSAEEGESNRYSRSK